MVDVIRAAQVAGIIAADVRPELCPFLFLFLFLFLGAGSHLFDVSALARHSQGIDTSADWQREQFVLLMRTMLEQGLFGSSATAGAGAGETLRHLPARPTTSQL